MSDSAAPSTQPGGELELYRARPGTGGNHIDETAPSLVAIAVGYLLMLLGMFFSSFLLLGLGLVVLLVGAVWRAASRRRR